MLFALKSSLYLKKNVMKAKLQNSKINNLVVYKFYINSIFSKGKGCEKGHKESP